MTRVLLAEDQQMFRTAAEGTVRNRVSEILGKPGARNRSEAVQIARESGWL